MGRHREQNTAARRNFLHYIVIIAFAATTASSEPAQAQATDPASFLRLQPGTRAAALGGAFTALAADPTAALWNAAGLVRSAIPQSQFEFARFPFDRSVALASARMNLSRNSGLGLGWYTVQVQGIEARAADTPAPDATFNSGQNLFYLSYALRLNEAVAAGVTLKGYYHRLAGLQATGGGFDFGMQYVPRPNLRFGLAMHDLGGTLRWNSGRRESISSKLRIGAAQRIAEIATVAADIQFDRVDGARLFWGLELAMVPQLPLRLGFGRSGLALGTGMQLQMGSWQVTIDYALSRDALLGDPVHHFGFRFARRAPRRTRLAKKFPPPPTRLRQMERRVQVTARVLNVRSGPGLHHSVVNKVRRGEKFPLLELQGDWAQIRLESGGRGWVHRKYVVVVESGGAN